MRLPLPWQLLQQQALVVSSILAWPAGYLTCFYLHGASGALAVGIGRTDEMHF
jgi:hypothetical protein